MDIKKLKMMAIVAIVGTVLHMVFSFVFWLLPYRWWLNGFELIFLSVAFLLTVPFWGGFVWLLKKEDLKWQPTAFAVSGQVLFWLIGALLSGLLVILCAADAASSPRCVLSFLVSACSCLSAICALIYWSALLFATKETSGFFPQLRMPAVSCLTLSVVMAAMAILMVACNFNTVLLVCLDTSIESDIFKYVPMNVQGTLQLLHSVAQMGFMGLFFVLANKEISSAKTAPEVA